MARPGGRLAVTIWPYPPSPGQALLGHALEAAGVVRPPGIPMLAPEDDFPRSESGLTALLDAAGLEAPACRTVNWHHLTTPDLWWSGPAAGIAAVGQLLTSQLPSTVAAVRRHYDRLCAGFRTPDGRLSLPHTALLAHATAP